MEDEVRNKSAEKRPVTHLPPSALHSILRHREETKDLNFVMTSRLCLPHKNTRTKAFWFRIPFWQISREFKSSAGDSFGRLAASVYHTFSRFVQVILEFRAYSCTDISLIKKIDRPYKKVFVCYIFKSWISNLRNLGFQILESWISNLRNDYQALHIPFLTSRPVG